MGVVPLFNLKQSMLQIIKFEVRCIRKKRRDVANDVSVGGLVKGPGDADAIPKNACLRVSDMKLKSILFFFPPPSPQSLLLSRPQPTAAPNSTLHARRSRPLAHLSLN